MLDAVVESALLAAVSPADAEAWRVLSYARKWLGEHVELLCEEAGVEPAESDQLVRYL
jgi:hypothetical protein